MTPSNDHSRDLEELLSQVDELLYDVLPEEEYAPLPAPNPADFDATRRFDPRMPDVPGPDAPLPYEDETDGETDHDFDLDPLLGEEDEPIVFRNHSNRYGADLRNYSNGYGTGQAPVRPVSSGPIPAYNGDFRRPDRPWGRKQADPESEALPFTTYPTLDPAEDDDPLPQKSKEHSKAHKTTLNEKKAQRRRGKLPRGLLIGLVAFACVGLVVWMALGWVFSPPKAEEGLGLRKFDTATILLCGVDEGGTRTDTMMLVYLSGSEGRVGILSLPRDTYTITAAGHGAKLNSAYGRNGTGHKGMEGLLDYVQGILGYRPDGYLVLDMTIVPQIVDTMGGLTVQVPEQITNSETGLTPGLQTLNGDQVLELLRFRKGYAMQDLGRVETQRLVLSAALDQWLSFDHIGPGLNALSLLEANTLSSLGTRNYLWLAKTALLGMGNLNTHTLPGRADYIGDVSYYLLDREAVAELVDESYNPYWADIAPEDLTIGEG